MKRGLEACSLCLVYEGIQLLKGRLRMPCFLVGEKGYKGFSAYSLDYGKGQGDQFVWSDPAPAGSLSHFCNEKLRS